MLNHGGLTCFLTIVMSLWYNFQFAKVEQCNYKLAHHNSLSGMIPLTQDPQ